MVLHLNKLKSLSPKDALCQVWLNWPIGSGEEDFLNPSMYFCNFVIISPSKKAEPFIWTKLNSLDPRMICGKFVWNWTSVSGKDDFSKFVNVFSHFHNYLPLENNGSFGWINLNTLHPRIFCAKLGRYWPCVSGGEDFLKFVKVFSQFCNYLPLEKGRTLHFNKLEFTYPKMPSLVEIGPVVPEK